MLKVTLHEEDGIVMLEPEGALTEKDFESAATVIDPYIEATGELNGVVIHTRDFPGWDSFAALLSHLKFIRDHHMKVTHVAFVTDSKLGDLAESVGSHFVHAEVKHFHFGEFLQARLWILGLG